MVLGDHTAQDKALGKFADDVFAVRRAAAVAADEHLAPGVVAGANGLRRVRIISRREVPEPDSAATPRRCAAGCRDAGEKGKS